MRLKDARALMRSGNFEAAYYLTGLAVECAMKACIARNQIPPNQSALRDIYSHDLAKLIGATKRQSALGADTRRSGFPNQEAALKLLFLALRQAAKKWRMTIHHWREALKHFTILWPHRMPAWERVTQ
jgi:hypothetical protein